MLCITQILLPLSIYFTDPIKYIYKNINKTKENIQKNIWQLEIPKINLKGNIEDGTDQENLNKNIAHFQESAYIKGNICLAAHNRGYDVNYFKDIKKLKKGDKIIYKFKDLELNYLVTENKIINDTDIQVIDNTRENIITLITCVENQPEKRRCIRGKLTI